MIVTKLDDGEKGTQAPQSRSTSTSLEAEGTEKNTSKPLKEPFLLGFRSSVFFVTFVVGFGIGVDLCIYGIAAPVMPFRLRELGYENVSELTGWLVSGYAGGLVVSSPVIGYLGERIQSRRMPLIASLLFMIGALIMFMFSNTFLLLLISRILQGVSGTAVFTLGLALLGDCVPEENMAFAVGNALIGLSLGSVGGPAIGGALYERLGYNAPWIFSICIVAFDMFLRLLIIEPHQAVRYRPDTLIPAPRQAPSVRSYLNLLANARVMVSCYISFAVGIYFGAIMDTALTLRLNQRYGLNSLQAGLIFIANALPAAIVSPPAGIVADRFGPRWIALGGVTVAGPILTLLCIDKMPLPGFIVVLAGVGTFTAIPIPAVSLDLAAVARNTPGIGFAHTFSLFNLAFSMGTLVGPIMSGNILEHLGIPNGWYTMIGVTAGCWLLCIPAVLWKYKTKQEFEKSAEFRSSSEQLGV